LSAALSVRRVLPFTVLGTAFLREARAVLRPKVLGRLDLPRNARVVIYSAVLRVLGGPLLRDDQWRDSLKAICELRDDIPELRIVVKPWPGDDRDRLQRLMDEVADERVLYVDPDVDLHNVDLLSIADCVVGTFSSFLGEALLARAVPVLLDLPGTRYYFGDEVEHYRGIAMWASSPRGARNAVRRVVIGGEEFRDGFVRAAWPRLREIFGPLDGEAAKRIASAGIELLESARR